MNRVILSLVFWLVLVAGILAAPAPLPRRERLPAYGAWPCGEWESVGNSTTVIARFTPCGIYTEVWGGIPYEGVWHRDEGIGVFIQCWAYGQRDGRCYRFRFALDGEDDLSMIVNYWVRMRRMR